MGLCRAGRGPHSRCPVFKEGWIIRILLETSFCRSCLDSARDRVQSGTKVLALRSRISQFFKWIRFQLSTSLELVSLCH